MSNQDTFHRNHCVPKGADDYMLASDEMYQMQFSRLIENKEGDKKYVRSTVNLGHKQFMEIIDTYGIADTVTNRWVIWTPPTDEELAKNPKKKGKNVKYNET